MRKSFYMPVIFAVISILASCNTPKETTENKLSYVDPYIGSGGHGHVFVGANVPFGMIQLGPQNINKGWDWCSGYHHSDSILIGFSHTHLSGTGCDDMGDVLIMPCTGQIQIARGEQTDITNSYASYYSHKSEKASPGYYAVHIDKYNIDAEMAASKRSGIHRFKIPKTESVHLFVDLKEGNHNSKKAEKTYIRLVDKYTFEGYRFNSQWADNKMVYFSAVTDKPIKAIQIYEDDLLKEGNEITGLTTKAALIFEGVPSEVKLKVGLSSVSCENALLNINTEIPHWDIEQVKKEAETEWMKELNKIHIKTASDKTKRIFYTAMYHAFYGPTLMSDVNDEYRGADDAIHKTEKGYQYYSTFSLWDTYRTANPFYTIVQQEKINSWMRSFLDIYQQNGKLPVWALWGKETECMPGYSGVNVLADAWLKGFRDYDQKLAYEALIKSTTYEKQNGVPFLLEKEYIPADKLKEATSVAMEYAVSDWSVAKVAKELGKQADFELYKKRSKYYKHYFCKDDKFIKPKLSDGSFRSPYNPIESIHSVGDFCEGNGWQYTFFAPQDPEGLIELFGGDEEFAKKLDDFFVTTGDLGEKASGDITGLIGMYAHGNEPSHHIAYLYSYSGQQWKTAEKVRYILKEMYNDQPDGIIGNEDVGQMSAWYLMSGLGFYPVTPASGIYVFGSPVLDEAVINLPEGKTFTIKAINNSDKNIYIQSVSLNGKNHEKSFITHADVVAGGELVFTMGEKPNYNFGTAKENRPHSNF